jgi:ABC-type nitrate/sulfonate/bicarbonate transport system permease component
LFAYGWRVINPHRYFEPFKGLRIEMLFMLLLFTHSELLADDRNSGEGSLFLDPCL